MKLLYIDLFCGAGGTSTGVESARYRGKKCAKVIACVNHDANAIASHAANHPDALHCTEDIRTLDLTHLVAHVNGMRKVYPDAFVVLWASLECTNFSKAKGGRPRDADSRTLADHLFRYIASLKPDFIQIENVEEFMSWGDLDENGKPVSKDAGMCYREWVEKVIYGYHEYIYNTYPDILYMGNRERERPAISYHYDHRILNSADYGAYTSRRRFFGIFARHGLPIVFPEPTHARNGSSHLFGSLQPWKPVRDVLDFDDEGESIFGRKKPLVDATLERIYAGLIKFVAGGKEWFMVKYSSMSQKGRYYAPSIEDPCPTIATQGRLDVAQVKFMAKHFSGRPEGKVASIDRPSGAVTAVDHHSIVSADFLSTYYGNGFNTPLSDPAPTVTTKDRFQLVRPRWMLNPQYTSPGGSVDNPCFTLIARMDKMPPYLMTAAMESSDIPRFIQLVDGVFVYEIYEDDSPILKSIKEFMALYGIVDIKMRMLRIPELKLIQGFPENYILIGTKEEQKKFLGNAVVTVMSRALAEALVDMLYLLKITENQKQCTTN